MVKCCDHPHAKLAQMLVKCIKSTVLLADAAQEIKNSGNDPSQRFKKDAKFVSLANACKHKQSQDQSMGEIDDWMKQHADLVASSHEAEAPFFVNLE